MRKTTSLLARFESKVERIPFSGCWLWTGACWPNGYGSVRAPNFSGLAHRVAWTFYKGAIPEGLHVLHRCDVPACVNPDHLFLGTHLDNMIDMRAKGRRKGGQPAGERHHRAKLSESIVREIRASAEPAVALGARFDIPRRYVSDIRSGRVWRHLLSQNVNGT